MALGNTPAGGFNPYFSGELLVDRPASRENKYKNLGTNYATYFGQGERNIYIPVKTVSVNGFDRYFKEADPVLKSSLQNHPNVQESRIIQTADGMSEVRAGREACSLYDCRDHKRPVLASQAAAAEPLIPPDQRAASLRTIGTSNYFPDIKDDQREPTLRIEQNCDASGWCGGAACAEKFAAGGGQLPSMDLLNPLGRLEQVNEKHNAQLLEDVLGSFGVTAKVVNISVGPVITRYELSPAPGTKISKIVSLADDIALALASGDIRMEAPIPGKAAVGIEIPRDNPRTVFFREVIDTEIFRNSKAKLRVALGKNIANEVVVSEIEKMPHLLVAGATGSGKSIFINCLINSLLFTLTPDDVRLLMVDPKIVELSQYNGIPHLLSPVVTDPKKANKYLRHILREMENRYELFAVNGVRDIDHYNRVNEANKLPHIVVIIDELADLMMVASNEIEESICRLAQMSRAAGIHLVIATQRPSVNVITGLIKANIPSRISFAVSSQIDSRTILDTAGAEKLLGKGDMLYSPIGLSKPLRVHGCFIDETEVKRVIEHWKNQGVASYTLSEEQVEEHNGPEKNEEDYDDKFAEAAQLVISTVWLRYPFCRDG